MELMDERGMEADSRGKRERDRAPEGELAASSPSAIAFSRLAQLDDDRFKM